MRTARWLLPALAAGGVLLVGVTAAAAGPSAPPAAPGAGDGDGGPGIWKDADAPRRIRALVAPVEAALAWPGLGDYLVAVAYQESRGTSTACADPCGPGWSRGWFQNRPVVWCFTKIGLTRDAFLADEAAQVAVAVCHARRLGILYDEPGQVVQWRDIRRGWKFPHWVGESWREKSATQGNWSAFRRNLVNVGLPESFAKQKAFPSGLDVPDVQALYALTKGVSVT